MLPWLEFNRLMELAGQVVSIELKLQDQDLPTAGIRTAAEQGGAFDWLESEPDLYTVDDLRVHYR